jgi:carbonic anhydrase
MRHIHSSLTASLFSTLLVGAGCGAAPEEEMEKHWGYEDSEETVGPESWSSLPGDELCASGKQQTPIALATVGPAAASPADLPNMIFGYQPTALSVLNNGHTIQVPYGAGSTLTMGGQDLKLAQFHFHAPSEHTLDGQSFPMEIHLVHVNADGKPAAVVGIFVKAGATNAALASTFNNLPQTTDGKVSPAGEMIDASKLLPTSKLYEAYAGSLTTPPCTEGIQWRVMTQPIEMSTAQISAFTAIHGFSHTNRPLQSLNGRVVQLDTTP